VNRKIKYTIGTLALGLALAIGCAGEGADSGNESAPSGFQPSAAQATRSAEWLQSEEYKQEKKVLEEWQEIRESNPSHYSQLRTMSGEIRRMIPNWRGRSRGSEDKEATACWEINVYRTMVGSKEDAAMLFQQYHPEQPLAFEELYSEMDELYKMLDGHEKLCEDKYGIIPP